MVIQSWDPITINLSSTYIENIYLIFIKHRTPITYNFNNQKQYQLYQKKSDSSSSSTPIMTFICIFPWILWKRLKKNRNTQKQYYFLTYLQYHLSSCNTLTLILLAITFKVQNFVLSMLINFQVMKKVIVYLSEEKFTL